MTLHKTSPKMLSTYINTRAYKSYCHKTNSTDVGLPINEEKYLNVFFLIGRVCIYCNVMLLNCFGVLPMTNSETLLIAMVNIDC